MKTYTFNERLTKFDPEYFTKGHQSVTKESELIKALSTWLYYNDFALDKSGWNNFMKIRASFPEIYWTVLDVMFCGDENDT